MGILDKFKKRGLFAKPKDISDIPIAPLSIHGEKVDAPPKGRPRISADELNYRARRAPDADTEEFMVTHRPWQGDG